MGKMGIPISHSRCTPLPGTRDDDRRQQTLTDERFWRWVIAPIVALYPTEKLLWSAASIRSDVDLSFMSGFGVNG